MIPSTSRCRRKIDELQEQKRKTQDPPRAIMKKSEHEPGVKNAEEKVVVCRSLLMLPLVPGDECRWWSNITTENLKNPAAKVKNN
jgi:hypothetical protein